MKCYIPVLRLIFRLLKSAGRIYFIQFKIDRDTLDGKALVSRV